MANTTLFEYGPFIPLAVSNVTVTFDMLLLSNSLLTKFQDICSHFFSAIRNRNKFFWHFIHSYGSNNTKCLLINCFTSACVAGVMDNEKSVVTGKLSVVRCGEVVMTSGVWLGRLEKTASPNTFMVLNSAMRIT